MSDAIKSNTAAVILAAGLGKRMKSDLPKILHKLGDKYLVDYVIENVRQAGVEKIILVIGHKYELVQTKLADRGVEFAIQQPQLGTGHAVQIAMPALGDFNGDLLALCGDMPLISSSTIAGLLEKRRKTGSAATVLTARLDKPGSYGRIVRNRDGFLKAIIEYRDADDNIRQIDEVNTGAYCFDNRELKPVLKQLKSENAQSEYYLTDTIALFRERGLKVSALISDNPDEGLGINSKEELILMETKIKEQRK
ncbi:MAG: NTP transferase domain-containing protein [candidate division Zixibacteria bacterium]|nr:NTP transferase domain-containing protein [candidate division Zixibacteria bacterium]